MSKRNLTAEAIAEVGPLSWVLEDTLYNLEDMNFAEAWSPRIARALIASAMVAIKPGASYRRVMWTKADLTDAADMLAKFGGCHDYAASVGRAAQMVSTLLEGLDE